MMLTIVTLQQLPHVNKTNYMSEAFHIGKRSICHYLLYFHASHDLQLIGTFSDLIKTDLYINYNSINLGEHTSA